MIQKVGRRLKAVRQAQKIDVKDMAVVVGCSVRGIRTVEQDLVNPNLYMIARLCHEYDVSIDSLVYDTAEQFEELLNDLRGVRVVS